MNIFRRYFGSNPSGYKLRTKDGRLVALIDNNIAGVILRQADGNWVTKEFTDGTSERVFVIYAPNGQSIDSAGVRLYIWDGYYLAQNTTITD